jgi:hypothetical protein
MRLLPTMSRYVSQKMSGKASESLAGRVGCWRPTRLISTLVAVPALLVLSACGGSAPSQPTVQAAATQAVGAGASAASTAQAAASPVAATAQAAVAPVAATVQAAGPPAAATLQAGGAAAASTAVSVGGTAASAIPPLGSPSPSPAAQVPR